MAHREALYYGDLPTNTADTAASGLDEAFLRRARLAVDTAPATLQHEPSAAASPILRTLLWAAKSSTGTEANASTSVTAAGDAGAGAEAKVAAPVTSLASQVLARRGVLGGQKDPALARLEKKRAKQQQQQQQQQSLSSPAAQAGATPLPVTGARPWTQRRLSEMTETSWKTLREHIGVTVEVAQHKHTTRSTTSPSDSTSIASLHTLFAQYGAPVRCWEEAGLPYALGKSVVARYALPTAVQSQCVPLITSPPARHARFDTVRGDAAALPSSPSTPPRLALLHGFDVLAVADTGSGKTAGYVVPVLAQLVRDRVRLLGHDERIALGPQALILVPTRELAEQVMSEVQALLQCAIVPAALVADASTSTTLRTWHDEGQRGLTHTAPVTEEGTDMDRNALCELRVVKLVGGEDRDAQYNALVAGAHLVIGTVGQLHSMLEDRLLSLGNTTTIVVDEADRMLDEHLSETLVDVLQRCPKNRQTLLFTATLGESCAALAKSYLSPEGYLILRISSGCASIRQSFEVFPTRLLRPGPPPPSSTSDDTDKKAAAGQKRGRARVATESHTTGAWHRPMDARVHPEKFARLVTWLIYAGSQGRVVVFANTKSTCDALQEELEKEAAFLQEQAEASSLPLLIGDCPAGLFFQESGRGGAPSGHNLAHHSASAGPGHTHGQLCVANLTSTAVVHSGLSRAERERLVKVFRAGQRRVLLTTDLLARGLDVKGVSLVISYDAPHTHVDAQTTDHKRSAHTGNDDGGQEALASVPSLDDDDEEAVHQYEHRVGRTGRAGATGVAVSFLCVPAPWLAKAALSKAAAAKAARTGDPSHAFQWHDDTEDGSANEERDSDGEDEDASGDGDGEDSKVHRRGTARRRRLETSRSADGAPASGPVYLTFPSDMPFLKPLWRFLLHCAEVNVSVHPRVLVTGTASSAASVPPSTSSTLGPGEAEEEEQAKAKADDQPFNMAELTGKGGARAKYALENALRTNRYVKVHLDGVLAELLFQLTRSARYGALTK